MNIVKDADNHNTMSVPLSTLYTILNSDILCLSNSSIHFHRSAHLKGFAARKLMVHLLQNCSSRCNTCAFSAHTLWMSVQRHNLFLKYTCTIPARRICRSLTFTSCCLLCILQRTCLSWIVFGVRKAHW